MSKRAKFRLLTLTFIIVVALLVVLTHPPERVLLDRAKVVTGIAGWLLTSYHWRTDRKIVAVYTESGRWQAVEVDAETGVRLPMSRFLRSQPPWDWQSHEFHLSPDGKWFLWLTISPRQATWETAAIDGSRHVGWTSQRSLGSAVMWQPLGGWLPDSRGWVELSSNQSALHALIHRRNMPHFVRDVPLTISKGNSLAGPNFPEALLGFTPSGRAIATTWLSGQVVDVDLWEFGLETGAPPPRKFTVRIPAGARVDGVVLSPRGDRLAWRFFFTRQSLIGRWAGRILPFYHEKPRSTVELWVSKLDGSEMRAIGGLEVQSSDDYHPDHLRWTPDGRRLSFIYLTELYTVPAE